MQFGRVLGFYMNKIKRIKRKENNGKKTNDINILFTKNNEARK